MSHLPDRNSIKKRKVVRIVLTGGPCGGKSSALTYLKQKLEEQGFLVFFVPEAATICINGGISPKSGLFSSMVIQHAIMTVARTLEDVWIEAIKTLSVEGSTIVVIYDRGLADSKAYMNEKDFVATLRKQKLHRTEARDGRYDAVMHLVTAAIGAEAFYTLRTNEARTETAEEARAMDKWTMDAWIGHPHMRVIDNSTDFQGKLKRVYQEVCQVLGIPIPIERERRFLVEYSGWDIPSNAQRILIEQIYLESSDPKTTLRVRKRGQHEFFTYYQTIKEPHTARERLETESMISAREYVFASRFKLRGTNPIRKTRVCFVYESQYFELDIFKGITLPENARGILEIELTDEQMKVKLPPWIRVIKEVTENAVYSNRGLAEFPITRE